MAITHLLSLYPYSYEPLPVWKEPSKPKDAPELMQGIAPAKSPRRPGYAPI